VPGSDDDGVLDPWRRLAGPDLATGLGMGSPASSPMGSWIFFLFFYRLTKAGILMRPPPLID
jgi:hypothetical protein